MLVEHVWCVSVLTHGSVIGLYMMADRSAVLESINMSFEVSECTVEERPTHITVSDGKDVLISASLKPVWREAITL